jgi:hypothetical protein
VLLWYVIIVKNEASTLIVYSLCVGHKLIFLFQRIQFSLNVNSCMEISYFYTNEGELIIMQFFGVCIYCLQFYDLYDTTSEVTIQELKLRKVITKQASKTIYRVFNLKVDR